jgi:hypothetical protein
MSDGKIDKVVSKDVDHYGLDDIVVSGRHAEIFVLDRLRGCEHPPTARPRPFSYVFLRKPGAFSPEVAAYKRGETSGTLRVLGAKGRKTRGMA